MVVFLLVVSTRTDVFNKDITCHDKFCHVLEKKLIASNLCFGSGQKQEAEEAQKRKQVVGFFYVQTEMNMLGVSKNRGTPKWMVKIMENPIFNG